MTTGKHIWRGPPTTIEIWDEAEGKASFTGFVDTGAEIPVELDTTSQQVANWLAFRLIEPAKAPDTTPDTPRRRRENTQENTTNG